MIVILKADFDLLTNKKTQGDYGNTSAPLAAQFANDKYSSSQWYSFDENQCDTIETNHTHILLLDDGSEGERKTERATDRFYINDVPRVAFVETITNLTKCHSVTIFIEGGLNSLEIILNDLNANRPMVIIRDSGGLATAIGNLFESAQDRIPLT